ncbi:Ankyrin repeat-containing protein P16F5.05c [Daldinia childiae]|uniref:Ankyrin repeat-containing protein P16F5.05c n=1 Tax=Daldinia childiae TaxID=326645 RepID=UPI001445E469|nr:Ankyrin repeat-containing protein P16F5.05c [Daldinia childiae]KAF3056569.1 Ankyrin repeat-containing protein P16F5.05c [Daldinia childiae]
MAPKLSEDEIDDLIYLARTGDDAEFTGMVQELAVREGATRAEIIAAARDDGKATCLHMAAANGHAKTVTLILSHFPAPSKASKEAEAAAAAPSSDEVSPSTSTETEVPYINLQNSFGNTALHWACLGGHLDVVKLLLSRGASPTAANDKDQIPLDLAAFNNHMHVVDYFLSQSKDLEGDNAKEGGLEKGAQDVQMTDDGAAEDGKAGGSADGS